MPVPQIMLGVGVASSACFHSVQFLDKSPIASMTGALGRQYRNCGLAVAVLTLGSMSLLCRASFSSWGLSVRFGL